VQSIDVSLFVLEPAVSSSIPGDGVHGPRRRPEWPHLSPGKLRNRENAGKGIFSYRADAAASARDFREFHGRQIECRYESVCSGGIALGVPLISSSCLSYRLRMEFNAWTSHGIVRGFGVWRRTREPFSLFPYLNRQRVARSPYSTLLPRPHPPSHLNFRSDDRRAQRALPQEGAVPLPKPFCGWCSWNEFYNSRARQHKFKAREVR